MNPRLKMGSSNGWVTTTEANQELINFFPPEWTVKAIRTLSFISATNCTLIVNGKELVFADSNLGIQRDERFEPVWSLKVKESGTSLFFLFGY